MFDWICSKSWLYNKLNYVDIYVCNVRSKKRNYCIEEGIYCIYIWLYSSVFVSVKAQ